MDEPGFSVPHDAAILKRRMDAFLGTSSQERVPSLKKEGLANLEAMKAFDNSLRGFGFSSALFKPPTPLRPLDSAKEKRCFLPADKLDDFLCKGIGLQRRSVIVDLRTNESRLETSWHEERHLLVGVTDAGSIGMPPRHFLYSSVGGLRGWIMADPCHVRWGHHRNAIRAAGLLDIYHEGKVLIGLRKGPWSGAAHYQAFRSVLANIEMTSGPNDELFKLCLHDIAADVYKGTPPNSAFEEEGIDDMWRSAWVTHRRNEYGIASPFGALPPGEALLWIGPCEHF